MNRILKHIGLAAALIACVLMLTTLAPAPAGAQANPYRVLVVPGSGVTSYSSSVTAVDTSPAILVKYIGSTVQASTFAVTTYDYIFTVGGGADTTITGCGASAGTLDTAQTGCDTVAELVNKINASANWLAVPVGCLGDDSTKASGVCAAADIVATAGAAAAGVTTYIISAQALASTVTFFPSNSPDIREWSVAGKPKNPFTGLVTTVQYYLQNFVGSAAAGNIYAVKDVWSGSSGKTYSQTYRVLYAFTGAATGVDKAIDLSNSPIFCRPGERIIIRGASGTTHTSPRVNVFGFSHTF